MENIVILQGEVDRLDKVKSSAGGFETLDFKLRTWKKSRGEIKATVHTVSVWGDNVNKFKEEVKRGDIVSIHGELHYLGDRCIVSAFRVRKVIEPEEASAGTGRTRNMFE